MAYLKQLGQLNGGDINAMFRYYLNRIREVDHTGKVRNYLRQSDYEHLEKLLEGLEGGKSATAQD